MEEVLNFIKESKVYFLSTVEKDQPRVRPFGTMEIFDGKLCIQTGKIKNVSKQIKENPKVEICAFNNGRWIRITGELYSDDRIEAKKYMLDKNPELRNLYDENDDNTEVLYLKNAKAIISSFTEDSREIIL